MRQAGRPAAGVSERQRIHAKLAAEGDSSGPGRRPPTGVLELNQGGVDTHHTLDHRPNCPSTDGEKTALDAAPEFAGLR